MKNDRPTAGDNRDVRAGAYDSVNDFGKPQPTQIRQATTPHEAAQPGADLRPDPLPSENEVLPERLRRAPQGPLSPRRPRQLIGGAQLQAHAAENWREPIHWIETQPLNFFC